MEVIAESLLNYIQSIRNKNILLSQIPNLHLHFSNQIGAESVTAKTILFQSSAMLIEEISLLNHTPSLFIFTQSLSALSHHFPQSAFNWTTLTAINYDYLTDYNNNGDNCGEISKVISINSLEEFIDRLPSLLKAYYTSNEKKEIFSIRKCFLKIKKKHNIDDTLLVTICKEIMSVLKSRKEITCKELTEHIAALTSDAIDNSSIYLNIQRRVYETINVLKALNVVRREKNVVRINDKLREKEKEATALKALIKTRKLELYQRVTQLAFSRRVIQKNKKSYSRLLTQDKIHGQFFLIKVNESRAIHLKQSEDQKRLVAFSSQEFDTWSYDDIIKSVSSLEQKTSYLDGLKEMLTPSCFNYLTQSNYYDEYLGTPSPSLLSKKRKRESHLLPSSEITPGPQCRYAYSGIGKMDDIDSSVKKEESRSFASSTYFNSKN